MTNQVTHGGKRPGSGRKKGTQNKATQSVKALALNHSEEALNLMVTIMNDPEAPPAVRVAADKVLDRAIGKPKQEVEMTAEVGYVDVAALNAIYKRNMEKSKADHEDMEARRLSLLSGKQAKKQD